MEVEPSALTSWIEKLVGVATVAATFFSETRTSSVCIPTALTPLPEAANGISREVPAPAVVHVTDAAFSAASCSGTAPCVKRRGRWVLNSCGGS